MLKMKLNKMCSLTYRPVNSIISGVSSLTPPPTLVSFIMQSSQGTQLCFREKASPSSCTVLQVVYMYLYMGLFSRDRQSDQPHVLQHCRVYSEPMVVHGTTETALSFSQFSTHRPGLSAGNPVFPQMFSSLQLVFH